jgi:hypothetical protein
MMLEIELPPRRSFTKQSNEELSFVDRGKCRRILFVKMGHSQYQEQSRAPELNRPPKLEENAIAKCGPMLSTWRMEKS